MSLYAVLVDIENRDAVSGRWFDLWGGAVAINAMCVARGLSGTASFEGGLKITLDRLNKGWRNVTTVS